MRLEFELNDNDLVNYNLFTASKSKALIRRRLISAFVFPALYVLAGLIFLLEMKVTLAITFFTLAALWFLFYPRWEGKRYLKHYESAVKENSKNVSDRVVILDFNEDRIETRSQNREAKILASEVAEINEIPELILIKLKGGQSFLLPKKKIEGVTNVQTELKRLALLWEVSYNVDINWKWK